MASSKRTATTMTATNIAHAAKFIMAESTSELPLLPETTNLCSPDVNQIVMPASTSESAFWKTTTYFLVAMIIVLFIYALMTEEEEVGPSQFKELMKRREEKNKMCRKDVREIKEEIMGLRLKLAQVSVQDKKRGEL